MKRELVEIPLGELMAVGTAHIPDRTNRTAAVVLINAGHVPRNGHGGLAVLLGNELCQKGWPILRVDLPGLGDSPGPLPERIESFWLALKDGVHAAWVAAVASWTKEAFGVERIIIGGVCGAAVTAVFTADRFPEAAQSLLLIEPELFTSDGPPPSGGEDLGSLPPHSRHERPASSMSRTSSPLLSSLGRLTSSWRWMRLLSRRRGTSRLLGVVQRTLLNAAPNTGRLPDRTNLELVEAWSRVSRRKVPMLILTANGLLWESYFLRIRQSIFGHEACNARHISVDGANHVFSNEAAKTAVLSSVPRWLENDQSI